MSSFSIPLPESATQQNPPATAAFAAVHRNIFHITTRSTIAGGLMLVAVICAVLISFLFIFHWYKTRGDDVESSHVRRVQPEIARRWAAEDGVSASATAAFGEIKTGEVGDCAICTEVFGEEEICRVIENCGHFFHKGCLDRWLRIERCCPLCRCVCSSDFDALKTKLQCQNEHSSTPVLQPNGSVAQLLFDSHII